METLLMVNDYKSTHLSLQGQNFQQTPNFLVKYSIFKQQTALIKNDVTTENIQ